VKGASNKHHANLASTEQSEAAKRSLRRSGGSPGGGEERAR
jgi:hypothetical protein